MTPEQEALKEKLFRVCLSRCNRSKVVKVEVLPYGFCLGSVDSWIEKQTSGWSNAYGMIGVGAERRKK